MNQFLKFNPLHGDKYFMQMKNGLGHHVNGTVFVFLALQPMFHRAKLCLWISRLLEALKP
jgi:hypothetical protein